VASFAVLQTLQLIRQVLLAVSTREIAEAQVRWAMWGACCVIKRQGQNHGDTLSQPIS
jgi:hypothetical protein